MKYAIVEHSGKQYLAEEGGRIEVDRLQTEVGKAVEFKEVLLIADGKKVEVGSPYVSGAKVKGKVLEHAKGKKITVFKYKPKERYRRKRGHRQQLTRISIESVALPSATTASAGAAKAAAGKKPAAKKASTAKQRTAASKSSGGSKAKGGSAGKSQSTQKKSASGGSKKKS